MDSRKFGLLVIFDQINIAYAAVLTGRQFFMYKSFNFLGA